MKLVHLSKVIFRMGQGPPHISNSKASDTWQQGGCQSSNLASHLDSLNPHRNFGGWSCAPLPWKRIRREKKGPIIRSGWLPLGTSVFSYRERETQLFWAFGLPEDVFEDSPVSAGSLSSEIKVQSRDKRLVRRDIWTCLVKTMKGNPWGQRTRGTCGIICSHPKLPELTDSNMKQMDNSGGIILCHWQLDRETTQRSRQDPPNSKGNSQCKNHSSLQGTDRTVTILLKGDGVWEGTALWKPTGHDLGAFLLTWETWGEEEEGALEVHGFWLTPSPSQLQLSIRWKQ